MEKENVMNDWGVKICPIRSKQCLEAQCAWWIEEDKVCAIKKIGISSK